MNRMLNNDLTAAINATVDAFVHNITEIAGKAARQLVENTFGTVAGGTSVRSAVIHGTYTSPVVSRGKRSAEDLDALCDKFASFVAANPGLRIEQINKKLGTKTKNLALPIRKLLASGRVKSKGQKRSTTYFPGKAK